MRGLFIHGDCPIAEVRSFTPCHSVYSALLLHPYVLSFLPHRSSLLFLPRVTILYSIYPRALSRALFYLPCLFFQLMIVTGICRHQDPSPLNFRCPTNTTARNYIAIASPLHTPTRKENNPLLKQSYTLTQGKHSDSLQSVV